VARHGLTVVPEDGDLSIVRHRTLVWGEGDEGTGWCRGRQDPSLFAPPKDAVNFLFMLLVGY
jgi:hypothetical protein